MLYRVKQIISRFKTGRVMSVYNVRSLRWKSQKLSKKIATTTAFVVLLALGVIGFNYMNTAKADWQGYITWDSQSDFETNPSAAGVTGQTARTNINTASSPGDVKLSAGSTTGTIDLKIDTGEASGAQLQYTYFNYDMPSGSGIKIRAKQAATEAGLASVDFSSDCIVNGYSYDGSYTYMYGDLNFYGDVSGFGSYYGPYYQWVDIQIELDSNDSMESPVLHDFNTYYNKDFTPPTSPTVTPYTDSNHTTTMPIDNSTSMPTTFSNNDSPSFKIDAVDDQSGLGEIDYQFHKSDYNNYNYQDYSWGQPGFMNIGDNYPLSDPYGWGYNGSGTYYVNISYMNDQAGNYTYPGDIFRYVYDPTPPTIPSSLTINPSGWTSKNDKFLVTVGASSDPNLSDGTDGSGMAGYQYKIDNSAWSSIITDASFNLPADVIQDGTHTLYIRSIDNTGNASNPISETYRYIGTSPSAPLPPSTPAVPVDQAISTENSFDFHWRAPSYAGVIKGYRYSVTGYDDDNNPIQPASGNSDLNTTFVSAIVAPDKTDQGVITNSSSLAPGLYYNTDTGIYTLHKLAIAKYQGNNTFYVVAVGSSSEKDMVTYDSDHTLAVSNGPGYSFSFISDAPSSPSDLQLFDISDRGVTPILYKVALKWTEPVVQNIDFAGYSIQRADCNLVNEQQVAGVFSEVGFSTNTSFIDDGTGSAGALLNSCYFYQVLSKTASGAYSWDGNPSKSFDPSLYEDIKSITPTGRYWNPATITSSPEVTVTSTVSKASFQWSTNRNSSSLVEFGINPITVPCEEDYGSVQPNDDSSLYINIHTAALDGLKPDTIYHYRAKFIDQDGNIGCSTDQSATFHTQPAPRIENVTIQDVRLYTALLAWNTSEPSRSDLLYGQTSDYSDVIENVSGGSTTVHSIRLDKLQDSTTYHFAIRIKDIDDNSITSDDYSFDTQKFPKISNVEYQPLTDQATAAFQVVWDTNVPTTSVVQFKPDGGTIQETVKTKLETQHSITINGLFDNTYYLMNTLGVDQFGNTASSESQRIKTAYDTRPPAISDVTTEVSNTEFGSAAKGQIVISWQTDEPGTSQVEYDFGVTGDSYGSRTQEDANLTTSHVVVLTDLRPSSAYHLRVISKDASGNKGVSEQQSVLTEQARSSILDVILNSLQSSLGWLFGLGK